MTQYTYDYPRPALTVDIVTFTLRNDCLQVLLVRRGNEPFKGMWALPGGFVHMEESLEEAAARELKEETGVQDAYLEQLYTYGDPQRDPRGRVVTVAYFALIPSDATVRLEGAAGVTQARWFPVEEIPSLAFELLCWSTQTPPDAYQPDTPSSNVVLVSISVCDQRVRSVYWIVVPLAR